MQLLKAYTLRRDYSEVEENETREHGGGEVEAEEDEEDEGAWIGMRKRLRKIRGMRKHEGDKVEAEEDEEDGSAWSGMRLRKKRRIKEHVGRRGWKRLGVCT
jgi:hypothetical protein